LASDRPPFRDLYDPSSRRLAEHVELVVNGRIYELVGGLTYLLRDGDTLTLFPGYAGGASERPRPS
jgi:molybdopterin converting factor small subunit